MIRRMTRKTAAALTLLVVVVGMTAAPAAASNDLRLAKGHNWERVIGSNG